MTPPVSLFCLALLLLSFSTLRTTQTQTQTLCLPDQRHALLQLKQGFTFTTDGLESWNASTDCCAWDGVTCDRLTGLVIELDLAGRFISGELNPALFNLTSLRYLNLAYNSFDNITLPNTGFDRLAHLTYLDFSNAGFAGEVPIGISLLTNLITLDLSNHRFCALAANLFEGRALALIYSSCSYKHNSLFLDGSRLQTLLSNFTKIRLLYLDGVNISSSGSKWSEAVSQVGHTLEELSMSDCSLTGSIDPSSSLLHLKQLSVLQLDFNKFTSSLPSSLANLSSLSVLSLRGSGLRGHFPAEIFHLTNLTSLDLSDNYMLFGPLPEFSNESFLQDLYLSFTNITGPIPDSIGNLKKLSTLDLSCSDFYGEVPASIANLTRLTYVRFSWNGLTGMIPMSLFSHPSLEILDLSWNHLTGYLSEFSNGSSTLDRINLSNNNLQGNFPISIFKLPVLYDLELASNNFTGTINLDIVKHIKNLYWLDLSDNKLSLTERQNHNGSFYSSFPQIGYLYLASCNLTKFPSFLNYQTNIRDLDLSSNKIDGAIPNWLWSNKALSFLNLSHNLFTEMEWDENFTSHGNLSYLDIHSNMITGSVPLVSPSISVLDFSSNQFSRWPPQFSFDGDYLSLSNNRLMANIPLPICKASSLQFLDLSNNDLTGTIPPCLLQGTSALKVINLKSNKLTGTFPRNISEGCGLKTIILSGNRIDGSLPQSLMNCKDLEVLDLENNQVRNRFPYFLGSIQNLRVLILSSNLFYGKISNKEMNHKVNGSFFPMLKVLDLSSNCFFGTWPENFFAYLKAMVTNSNTSTVPISYENDMGGSYYQNFDTVIFKGQSIKLESTISIFSSLDLSNNGFWGEIPKEIGQLKLLKLLNMSHNSLTGSIPPQFANLEQVESLDLSFNRLSGHIPQELTYLTFLSALNLSYNNLVGEIPQANQFITFSNDSYLGNPGLCDSPLSVQCGVVPSLNHGLNEFPSKSSANMIGLSVSIGVGFGVGFASVIWALVSWENGIKWFNFQVDRFYFRVSVLK